MVVIYLALPLNLLHLAVFTFTWQKVQHAATVMLTNLNVIFKSKRIITFIHQGVHKRIQVLFICVITIQLIHC